MAAPRSTMLEENGDITAVEANAVPVTVVSGYVGAGKTTLCLDLIAQLRSRRVGGESSGDDQLEGARYWWIKNEFGEAGIDAVLAKTAGVQAVEMVNGCLCCVLVGQLGPALEEMVLQAKGERPLRIFIETSGSAYPAPLAWEVRKYPFLRLDAMICVIDCLNFERIQDQSFTARLQAQYTDMILLSKWEHVSSDGNGLELLMDDLHEMNPDTPKLRCKPGGGIDCEAVIGMDSALFHTRYQVDEAMLHKDRNHHEEELEWMQCDAFDALPSSGYDSLLRHFCEVLPRDIVFRAKGLFELSAVDSEGGVKSETEKDVHRFIVFNYVNGRYTAQEVRSHEKAQTARLVFMGSRGMWRYRRSIGEAIGARDDGWRQHYASKLR